MCTSQSIPLYSPQQARLPTALALGSFDGLHAGHRSVISAITNHQTGIPTVVTFWPHPREVLYKESRLRIDLPNEKTYLLGTLGIKQLILIPFTKSLAELSPKDFLEKMVLDTMQAKKIAVGENFRFGKNREGDTSLLKKIAEKANVEVSILPIIEDSHGRMSSSRIRLALSEGDMKTAKNLMDRPYCFEGEIVKGKGLGASIGWPTANIQIEGRKLLPKIGVYSAWAKIKGANKKLPAVMNLGPQPTIDPESPSAVEVHLLNQKLDLSGKKLIIEPVKRLRGQERFQSLKELSNQIGIDAQLAKQNLEFS